MDIKGTVSYFEKIFSNILKKLLILDLNKDLCLFLHF